MASANSAATSHQSEPSTGRCAATARTMVSMISFVIQRARTGTNEARKRKASPKPTTSGPDSKLSHFTLSSIPESSREGRLGSHQATENFLVTPLSSAPLSGWGVAADPTGLPEPKLWQGFIAKSARKNSTFFEKNPLGGFEKLTAILQGPSL